MFDINTGCWKPIDDVLVEVTTVPAGDDVPRQLVLNGPGLALVQHTRGGTSLGGVAGPSLTPLGPGDRIILLPAGEIVLSLAVTATAGQTFWFKIVVGIADPARFVSSIVDDRSNLTAVDIAQKISRDGAVRLAIQRTANDSSAYLPDELANSLDEPLELLFGLRLREVLPDVVVIDGGGLAEMLQPGDVVGDCWILIERIGQGAAGDVWLVENSGEPEQRRALKILRNPAVASLVSREARQITRLEQTGIDFQHIARLMDIVPLDVPGLLYEYVPGDGLRGYVAERGGRLSESESIVLVQQLLSGLGELHQVGIIHRDLHPDNIIISGDSGEPQLKILDLGMAAFTGQDGVSTDSHLASLNVLPAHSFVEQLPVDTPPDPQADLYSVGVLLWWMLTGSERLPVGERLQDAWPQGKTDTLAIVQQATLTARDNRFCSASEMSDALAGTDRRWRTVLRRKKPAALPAPAANRSQSNPEQSARQANPPFRKRHPYVTLFSKAGLAMGLLVFAPLFLLGGLVFLALRFSSFARTLAVVAVVVLAVPVMVFTMILLTTVVLVFG